MFYLRWIQQKALAAKEKIPGVRHNHTHGVIRHLHLITDAVVANFKKKIFYCVYLFRGISASRECVSFESTNARFLLIIHCSLIGTVSSSDVLETVFSQCVAIIAELYR